MKGGRLPVAYLYVKFRIRKAFTRSYNIKRINWKSVEFLHPRWIRESAFFSIFHLTLKDVCTEHLEDGEFRYTLYF